ncbi:hypothetical protein [Caballeronia hypogeia]|nr:hypothetical protein [Caballeronia hypogeia]
MAKAMYILGQIGAIICHESGPCPQTAVLTKMASRPAEGFSIAVASMDELCSPQLGNRRTLLRWKHREIRRLRRMLPDPLPTAASAQSQMPFWDGYCRYWQDMLKADAQNDAERPAA